MRAPHFQRARPLGLDESALFTEQAPDWSSAAGATRTPRPRGQAASADTPAASEAAPTVPPVAVVQTSAAIQILNGSAGDDVLFGSSGRDRLLGGEGRDLLFGDLGNDTLQGGAHNDVLYGGEGNDLLQGNSGNDVLSGETGQDVLDGGSGTDQLFGGLGDDVLRFNGELRRPAGHSLADGGSGIDTLSLTLSDTQMANMAVRADLDAFAGFAASHVQTEGSSGPLFSFSTLALDARNIEHLVVNGVEYSGARARIHIDPSAPEGGNGSLLHPYKHWRDVPWQADTDYVQKAGTVAVESFSVTLAASEGHGITLGSYGDEPTGAARHRPQIQGAVTFEGGASYATLQGLDLSGASFGAVTVRDGAHHITVRDNEIHDARAGVLIDLTAGGDQLIEGNIIHNNAGQGVVLDGGVAGHGNVVRNNSIIANGLHGVEILGSHVIVEGNEVMSNGNLAPGTSGIHTFVDKLGGRTQTDVVIRLNVVSDSQENFGPDGNGIELDHWTRFADVYSNVLYGNDGQGFVAFQTQDWRFFDNAVFDNMQSPAHNNYARPAEVLILSYSLDTRDQNQRFTFMDNVVASSGAFTGSSGVDIVPILIDAPTIFWQRNISGNTYHSANGGDLYNWGFSPDGIWGDPIIDKDMARWNALKQNGAPDVDGAVALGHGDGLQQGSAAIDLMQGGTGDDRLLGAGGDDVLIGGAGNDLLDGGAGVDRLIGGRGDDLYRVDSSDDRIWEFPDSGTDMVYATFDYALPAFVENAQAQGTGPVGLRGNDLLNILEGNEATNGLQGGGAGDVLQGRGGNDNLFGDEGDDYLDGGSGNDLLQGGTGFDTLVGGAGDDVFVVRRGEGHDSILDFEGWYALHGDLLELHGYGAGASLSYTGRDGLWRIDFAEQSVHMTDYLTLTGVVVLSEVDDYRFVDATDSGASIEPTLLSGEHHGGGAFELFSAAAAI